VQDVGVAGSVSAMCGKPIFRTCRQRSAAIADAAQAGAQIPDCAQASWSTTLTKLLMRARTVLMESCQR